MSIRAWTRFALVMAIFTVCIATSVSLAGNGQGDAAKSDTAVAAKCTKGDAKSGLAVAVIGPRDEANVGCPKLTTREPAPDEIRITSAPFKLDKPGGKYILMNDISAEASALAITARNVTLDLNGHTVTYGTGVKLTENPRGIMTYNSLQKGNIGHSGIACPSRPDKTEDWPGLFKWNPGKSHPAKGLVLKNGRIKQGNGEGLAYSPALMLGGVTEGELYNLVIDVHAPDTEGLLVGAGTKVHHCTINHKGRIVTNRGQQIASIVSGGAEIYNNLLEGSPQVGVKANTGTIVHDNIIRMNITVTNGYGVQGWHQNNIQVYNNKIMPYEGRGIHLSEGSTGWDVHHNYVEVRNGPNKEYPREMTEHGIKLEQTSNSKVYNNVVLAVSVPGGHPTPLNVDIKPNSNNVIRNNTFIAFDRHNDWAHAAFMLRSGGQGTEIVGNTFYSNAMFVRLDWLGTSNNTFRRCTFKRIEPASKGRGNQFMDFGNSKPATGNVFVDCVFGEGVDPRTVHTFFQKEPDWPDDADYSVAWSLGMKITNGGKPAEGAEVVITDASGKQVAKGKADKKGKFSADLKEFTISYTKGALKLKTTTYAPYQVTVTSDETTRKFTVSPTAPMLTKFDINSSDAIEVKAAPAKAPAKHPIEDYWRKRLELARKEIKAKPGK